MPYPGSWDLTIPNNATDPASAIATDLKNTRQDIITWGGISMNMSTGAIKSGVTGSRPSSPAPVVGQLYFNTTTGALEVYDGSLWHPLNYHTVGQLIADAGSTSTLLKFDVRTAVGSADLAYLSDTHIIISCKWSPSTIADTLTIYSTNNSNYTTGRTARTVTITNGTGGGVIFVTVVATVQNMAVDELYWSVVPSGTGTIATVGQLYYSIHGKRTA